VENQGDLLLIVAAAPTQPAGAVEANGAPASRQALLISNGHLGIQLQGSMGTNRRAALINLTKNLRLNAGDAAFTLGPACTHTCTEVPTAAKTAKCILLATEAQRAEQVAQGQEPTDVTMAVEEGE